MSIDRRQFLTVLAAGVGGAALAGCGAPARVCSTPSTGPGAGYCLIQSQVIRVPGAASLAPGHLLLFTANDDNAALIVHDARGLYARSAICTHACCVLTVCNGTCTQLLTNPGECNASPVGVAVGTGPALICSCHGSEFTVEGKVVSGPATQPLPALALARDGADLLVDLASPVAGDVRLT